MKGENNNAKFELKLSVYYVLGTALNVLFILSH